MNKLNDAYYLDTRQDALGVFACPAGVNDYEEWLSMRYNTSNISVPYGVCQKVNMLVNASKAGADLVAIGPHAGAVAKFIEEKANNLIIVKVV